MMKTIVLLALVGCAAAACPNACSGHGTCNAYDECTCFDEGKSTYFGYLYDTAKGYNRIKQDAMRSLSSDSSASYNLATTMHTGPGATPANGEQAVSGGDLALGTTIVGSWNMGTGNTAYGQAGRVSLTASQNDRYLSKSAYVQKQYTGADCSQMTCPRGVSWSSPYNFAGDAMFDDDGNIETPYPTGFNQCRHKDFVECSDAGMCDRSSGACECFPGFEGAACQRTVCPNACSGHGQCQSNVAFSQDGSLQRVMVAANGAPAANGNDALFTMTESTKQVDPRKTYTGAWDSGIQYGCKCDNGFRGEDCSMMECPSTADPQGWYGNENGEDCSGRGLCDYSSGECACFTGFTGADCGTVEALA